MTDSINKPLISIIIPVYKVEPYLRKCVDSVFAQTYTNLEIILVDDGSPDNCGNICDEYAEKDKRIVVIHKENGGLSDARNAGLDIMKGEYVAFVDSDDWVSAKYVEDMYENLKKYDADISLSGTIYVYENNKKDTVLPINGNEGLYTQKEAVENLFYQKGIYPSACSKLYKSKLFETIRYPKGKLNEDSAITYKIFCLCDKISYTNANNYYYLQRIGSIENSLFSPKKMDAIDIVDEMFIWISENKPEYKNAAICRLVGMNLRIYREIMRSKGKFLTEKKKIANNIKKYRMQIIFNVKVKLKIRLACMLSYLRFGIL
jgi:glycosyltransferase involved in cell wall biosynthesis